MERHNGLNEEWGKVGNVWAESFVKLANWMDERSIRN